MANSSLAVRILPETERSLAFGSILASPTYTKVGGPLLYASVQLIFQNLTDGIIKFSWDGINPAFTLNATTSFILDVQSNKGRGEALMAGQGTQFWVAYATAPTQGTVYISSLYSAEFSNI